MPASFAPVVEFPPNAATHVAAACQQRDARRLSERFETTHNREQFQSAGSRFTFAVRGREMFVAADSLQHELPTRLVAVEVTFREEQVVRSRGLHCGWFSSAG